MKNFNKTTVSAFAAVALAGTSLVYAQFALINGGSGAGYGYGFGVGYGTDAGQYSSRTTGGPADQYLYGYGIVTDYSGTVGGGGTGGGGVVSGGGGSGYYTPSTGTVNVNGTTVTTTGGLTFKTSKQGNKGNFVRDVQEFLNKTQGAGIIVNGKFGPMTKKAVIAFQKKYGIKPAIGIVGPKTVAKLNALAAGK
jgi:Putative peptidoglycan binding domain